MGTEGVFNTSDGVKLKLLCVIYPYLNFFSRLIVLRIRIRYMFTLFGNTPFKLLK